MRILIVEDEFLIAMDLEDILTTLGHAIAGVASRIDAAKNMAFECEMDFAILDLSLDGVSSIPVSDILRKRGIPFMFASGYGNSGLEGDYRDEVVVNKPFGLDEIAAGITEALRKQHDDNRG